MKALKKLTMLSLLAVLMVAFTGCDDDDGFPYDNTPPASPRNVNSITGDNRVDVYWDHNTESDLLGYNVWRSDSYDGRYIQLGYTFSEVNYFVDYSARNGVTYFYGVTAYDNNNNESDLSPEEVFDTPRPEGFGEVVFDFFRYPETAGYDFSRYDVVEYNSLEADFFFENFEGTLWINVWSDTDIQDMGSTIDIYDITWAPSDGWVQLNPDENVKYVEAIEGNTYVIWTNNNHYAKIRVKQLTAERMVFDWAYQLVDGNRELKRNDNGETDVIAGSKRVLKKNHK